MNSFYENYDGSHDENSNDGSKMRIEESRDEEDGEWVSLDNKQDEFDQEREELGINKSSNGEDEMLPDLEKTPNKKMKNSSPVLKGNTEFKKSESEAEVNKKRKLENQDFKSNNKIKKSNNDNKQRDNKQNCSNYKNQNDNRLRNNISTFNLSTILSNSNNRNMIKVKLLIPAAAAGAVNGRGSEVLQEIERESGTKVSLERPNDPHPIENERLCEVEGNINCVLSACFAVYNRVNSLNFTYDKVDRSRLTQVILLVNDHTAGALIGANGANIKALRDNTGVHVQICKNRTEAGERTVVLEGRIESKFKALKLIFEKIAVTNRDLKTENGNFDMKPSNNIKNNNNRNNNNININNHNQGFDKSAIINNLNELSFTGLTPLSTLISKCGGVGQISSGKLSQILLETGFQLQGVTEILKSIDCLMKYSIIQKNSTMINNQPSLFNFMDLMSVDNNNNNIQSQRNLMRSMVNPNSNNLHVQNGLRNLIANFPNNNNIQIPNLMNNLNFPRNNNNNVQNNIALLKMLLNERQ